MIRINNLSGLSTIRNVFPIVEEAKSIPISNPIKQISPEEEYNKLVHKLNRNLDAKDLGKLNKVIPYTKHNATLFPSDFYPILIELEIDPEKAFKVLNKYINYKNSQNYGVKFESSTKLLASLILAHSIIDKLWNK